MSANIELGKQLKALRKKLKLSQADIAAKIGIQQVRYNYYEQGKRNPKIDFFNAVKEKLGVDLLMINDIKEKPIKTSLSKDDYVIYLERQNKILLDIIQKNTKALNTFNNNIKT